MEPLKLKPTSAPVKAYYETLVKFGSLRFDNEGNLRRAFEALLEKCARQFDWTVVPEYPIARAGKMPLRMDAALLDAFRLPRGYWEAKDGKDDLRVEMEKKFAAGYPRTNILFQSPARAMLFQNGRIAFDDEITEPAKLVDALRLFFEWREPHIEQWDRAVEEFSTRIPEIAGGAMKLIEEERKTNRTFVERFAAFAEVCRESINPDLKDEAVEEMLVQHLLTERIFRRIFDNPEFTRRNVIAAEIEKVIDSLTKKYFSRDQFLKPLDSFYKAIEEAASQTENYSEKQAFLNRVYEEFFQGFNRKQADTHGIVYTPQPIVDFMVRSVDEVLKQEFGRGLSDEGVHILDPFVGTGNFITRIMQQIKTSKLPQKYKHELHCNEVMLLPYYIASMNIEHAYMERTGGYEPFEGICLVDTFELAESKQAGFEFMSEGNTERIRRQKKAPIFVVIGNPPYSVGQVRENDNNKNRQYKYLDRRINETYVRRSNAVNTRSISDHFIRALRWATDRIGDNGVIAFITNNNFLTSLAADGLRAEMADNFGQLYVVDLGGNVRRNPKLSGTTHNVFGIQVGVCISILIRNQKRCDQNSRVYLVSADEWWRKERKFEMLQQWRSLDDIPWKIIDSSSAPWGIESGKSNFDELIPVYSNPINSDGSGTIFQLASRGVESGRDGWVYNFHQASLSKNIPKTIDFYNFQMTRFFETRKKNQKMTVDKFVSTDEAKIKWTSSLKIKLVQGSSITFQPSSMRVSIYRPFVKKSLYFDDFLIHRPGPWSRLLPPGAANVNIAFSDIGSRAPFSVLTVNQLPDFHLCATADTFKCLPFYIYDEDGTNRRENITDWALAQFQKHYGDGSITKWEIFHYTYAMLHHPEYRTRYAANLKRELPRIPMAPEFRRYAEIGAALMKLHIEYEQQPEWPLERVENGTLDWRVEKMSLAKDKAALRYNSFLTLRGIPPEVYEYRLGNRSALEWVVDQYRVSTDARSGIVNDPNREDDPEYIVRLIGQVVTVSVETVRLVRQIAEMPLPEHSEMEVTQV